MAHRSFLPTKPTKAEARKLFWVLGTVGLMMAGYRIIYPATTPPTGKWSWLTGPLFEAFGSYGIAGFYAAFGVFLIATALWNKD